MITAAALGKTFHQVRQLSHPVAPQRNGHPLFHGSPAKLKPGGSLHPTTGASEWYKKKANDRTLPGPARALAKRGAEGSAHRTYATHSHRIAKVFATTDYHRDGELRSGTQHVYRMRETRHAGWQPGAEHGLMGLEEHFSHHSVKPTHVQSVSGRLGLFGMKETSLGHSYANEGRHMKSGFVSKLRHNNVTPHAALNPTRSSPIRTMPKPKVRVTPRRVRRSSPRMHSRGYGRAFSSHHAKIVAGVAVAGVGVAGLALYAHHRAAQRAERARRVRR